MTTPRATTHTPGLGLRLSPEFLLLASIIAIAALIRFWNMPLQYDLHADDAAHFRYGQAFAETGQFARTEGRPGYALVLGAFIRFVGFNPTDGMIVSTLFGLTMVILTWAWSRFTFGAAAGLFSAAFAAFSAYPVFISKITNPASLGAALQAGSTLLLLWVTSPVGRGAHGNPRARAVAVASAGLLSGFCVSVHPAFASAPVVALGYLAVVTVWTRRFRTGLGHGTLFFAAVGLTVAIWELAFRLRPPATGRQLYLREIVDLFHREQNWRAITTPEPWYYFARVFDVIEGHWWMIIAIVSLAYGFFRVFHGDARFLAPSWFGGTVIAIGMVNVSTGGTAIPRAIVGSLPGLFVLMGGSLSSLGSAVTTRWKWPRRSYVLIALVALLPTIPFTAKVVLARTGVLPAVELVRREGGFLAAREFDPWVPVVSPSEVVLVGDKQALQPPEVRERLIQDSARPCFAALRKFVEVNGTVLVLGNNDPESVPQSQPTAVFRDDSARLEPAVLESFWGLGILTLTTLPTPELRLYRDEYLCREARPG